jgi:ABC-2 type transport system ATP-binding protein
MTSPLPLSLGNEDLAVATTGLRKRFDDVDALAGVNLQVPVGSVYLLVGPNGAGKTTLLKILLDLVRPTAGTAQVFGFDSVAAGPDARARIGYVPERQDWGYSWMRVERLLQHHSVYFPNWDAEYAARLVEAFGIRLQAKYGKLSKGEARRTQLVMALAHRPPLLLLDEPTDGLDPVMRDELFGILSGHLAETPTTVLVSTHIVHEMERLADHMGVLRAGRLQTQLPLNQLRLQLRRYRAEVPDGWSGPSGLNGAVLRRQDAPRAIQWTVWGEEEDIVRRLTSAGAAVREVTPLSLEDATLALLTRKD